MTGNVWEWQVNYYLKERDALGLRGGSWEDDVAYARVSVRGYYLLRPYDRNFDIGFRLVATLPNG